jgi:hypothetical protein
MIPSLPYRARCEYWSDMPIEIPDHGDTPLTSLGVCQVDDRPMAQHPRCSSCDILIGPGHHERACASDGLCSWCCWGAWRRQQRVGGGFAA